MHPPSIPTGLATTAVCAVAALPTAPAPGPEPPPRAVLDGAPRRALAPVRRGKPTGADRAVDPTDPAAVGVVPDPPAPGQLRPAAVPGCALVAAADGDRRGYPATVATGTPELLQGDR